MGNHSSKISETSTHGVVAIQFFSLQNAIFISIEWNDYSTTVSYLFLLVVFNMTRRVAPDKWRHFFAGIILGVVLQSAGWWLLPRNLQLATFIVFMVVLIISYGFELFSKVTGKGRYDFMDAVATVIGGMVGMGIALLLILLLV